MGRRPDGFDQTDFDDGVRLVSSTADLLSVLDEYPVLSSPILHSRLRAALEEVENPVLAERCDTLVRILHERAYLSTLLSAVSQPKRSRTQQVYTPPVYFAQLVTVLGTQVPPACSAPIDPASHDGLIRDHLKSASGDRLAALEAYTPTLRSKWLVAVLKCLGCKRAYAVARPYLLDLKLAEACATSPACVDEPLCPACGTLTGWPLFIWVCEGAAPGDALNGMSTLVRVESGRFTAWFPPAGTMRDARLDRVLEMRFARFERDTRVGELTTPTDALRATTFIYEGDRLDALLRPSTTGPLPFEMWAIIHDLTQRLKLGQASYLSAAEYVRSIESGISDGWPILLFPALVADDPHAALAHYLVTDACVRCAGVGPYLQVAVATEIARAHLALGNDALAAAELVRAKRVAQTLRAGDEREHLLLEIEVVECESLFGRGEYSAVVESLGRFNARHQVVGGTLATRVSIHQLSAYVALALFRAGECDKAFLMFDAEVASLETLRATQRVAGTSIEQFLVRAIDHSLGGALANWASLLLEVAEDVGRSESDRVEAMLGNLTRRERLALLAVLQDARDETEAVTIVDAAIPATVNERFRALARCVPLYLARFHPEESAIHAADIRTSARTLLERALSLSVDAGSWNHAGRQALRLAELAAIDGDAPRCTSWVERALDYAQRVPDEDTVGNASLVLARVHLQANDGRGALLSARRAAQSAMRVLTAQGHRELSPQYMDQVAAVALRAATFGAPALECIVTAESVRSVTLGVSLTEGLGFVANEMNPAFSTRLRALRRARERLRSSLESDATRDVEASLNEVEKRIDRVRREAYAEDPRYGWWCDATAADVSDAQSFARRLAARKPTVTYVGFLPCQQRILVYAAWSGGSIVDAVEWPDLSPPRIRFPGDYGGFVREDGGEGRLDEEKLRAWSSTLLTPLAARLRSLGADDILVFSVCPPFDQIPFAALELAGSRLCERVGIAYVNGIAAYEACERRGMRATRSILCVGDPSRSDMPPLPEAGHEARWVAKAFRDKGMRASALVEAEATFSALKNDAAEYDVFHFACHATTRPGDARPFLMLSEQPGDSGVVSVDRVLRELRLPPGAFVNLASCNSAFHEDSVGPSAGGLVPAFLISGAGAVLASLWSLDDRAAKVFAEAFYKELLSGNGPTSALARVQRCCIAGELGATLERTERWGTYVLYGSGR